MQTTIARKWAEKNEFCIYLLIFKWISLFPANNSFSLEKQSFQKLWARLRKLLAKTLKNMRKWFIFKSCNFTKNEVFSKDFSGDFFHRTSSFILVLSLLSFYPHAY